MNSGHIESFKVDIHHHSSADPTRKSTKDDAEIKQIIEDAKKNDVKLICITDHNQISWEIIEKYNKYSNETIKVLPGLEAGFKISKNSNGQFSKLDIVFIFDDSQENIKKLKNKIDEYPFSLLFNKKRIDFFEENGYAKIQNFLIENQIKFLTSVHYSKSSNSIERISSTYRNYTEFAFFDIFEGKISHLKTQPNLEERFKVWKKTTGKSNYPFLHGSDLSRSITAHKFKKSIKDLIFVTTEKSFNGLVKVAKFPEKRIFRKSTIDRPYIVDPYIDEIKIQNPNENFNISLQPGLNVIIGRRGSGKSELLKNISKSIESRRSGEEQKNSGFKVVYSRKNVINEDLKCLFLPQNFLIDELQKLYTEVKKANERLQKESILKSKNKEYSYLKHETQKIKESKDDLVACFEDLLKKITEKIELGIEDKKQDLEIKLKNSIDIFLKKYGYKDLLIKAFEADLFLLKNYEQEARLEFTKNQLKILIKDINKLLNKFKHEKYDDQNKTIIFFLNLFSDLTKNAKTQKEQILTSIEQKLELILSSVNKYNENVKKIMDYIEKNNDIFKSYSSESASFEAKDCVFGANRFKLKGKIEIKVEIKNETSFFDFLKYELLFAFKNVNFKKVLKIQDLIKLSTRKTSLKQNEDYNDCFTKVKEIWIEGEEIKGSEGQKQELFLKKILEKLIDNYKIILLDQPSDNLDSLTIKKTLINDFIIKQAFQKQLIIVTHDAKIALNADPQSLIIANYDEFFKKNNTYYNWKNLNLIKEKSIQNILDGEKDYPYKRFENYGGYYAKTERD